MSRGIGAFDPFQELLPEWTAVPFGLLTQLGDVWFLSLVVAALYWTRSRRREDVAVVAAAALVGFAAVDGLKRSFALPRPDRPLVRVETLPELVQPLYEATGTAGGYGFPSGHAVMATVVYLGLVDALSVGSRRRRFAGAVALVAAISLTRVALGVHYLVDVVAGVGVGLAVLALVGGLAAVRPDDRATAAFGLAVLASGLGLAAVGPGFKATVLVGASLGAFGGWQLVLAGRLLESAEDSTGPSRPLLGRLALAGLAFAGLALVAIAGVAGGSLASAPVVAGAVGAVLAGAVAAPALVRSDRARRAWTALTS